MRMMPIASGSSGNCIYIGSDDTHILIDAGISHKKIEEGLNSIDVSLKDIENCTDIINSKLRGVPIDELAEKMGISKENVMEAIRLSAENIEEECKKLRELSERMVTHE